MRPPLVYMAVPLHTRRMDPVCIFLVTRLALRAALLVAFIGFLAVLLATVLTAIVEVIKFEELSNVQRAVRGNQTKCIPEKQSSHILERHNIM